jgi:hypothetical protein
MLSHRAWLIRWLFSPNSICVLKSSCWSRTSSNCHIFSLRKTEDARCSWTRPLWLGPKSNNPDVPLCYMRHTLTLVPSPPDPPVSLLTEAEDMYTIAILRFEDLHAQTLRFQRLLGISRFWQKVRVMIRKGNKMRHIYILRINIHTNENHQKTNTKAK